MKYFSTQKINNAIRNIILSFEESKLESYTINPIITKAIIKAYFDLTGEFMSNKREEYIKTLSHKQGMAILKYLRSL